MEISKEKLLKVITLVDESTNTIIAADEGWDNNAGLIPRGFFKKAHMPENEFKEAMSGNPKEYIFTHYLVAEGDLEYLSIDETLNLVNDPSSNFHARFWRFGGFTS